MKSYSSNPVVERNHVIVSRTSNELETIGGITSAVGSESNSFIYEEQSNNNNNNNSEQHSVENGQDAESNGEMGNGPFGKVSSDNDVMILRIYRELD
jgi:hypothetical protein